MKHWHRFSIILILILIYIILINFFSSILLGGSENIVLVNKANSGGEDIKIGVSDSVSVTVTRKTKLLFWKSYSIDGDSYIKIFNLIKLPNKVNGFNFMIIHTIFFSLILLVSIIILTPPSKKEMFINKFFFNKV